jgi:arylsulfatase A-like enzyme
VVAAKSGESFGDESGSRRQTFEGFVRQMNACVPAIDEGVGRLIAALKETGQWENTLVIFTADQGFGMGEHGFRTKLGPYDATYRSPLIVRNPGMKRGGSVCPVAVNAPDLVATMLAHARITVPWEVHGRDLSPLLADPSAAWEHPCFYEFSGEQYGRNVRQRVKEDPVGAEYHHVPWYSAVVHNGWKLIHYWKPDVGDELYHLSEDPEELRNQIQNPNLAQRVRELRGSLRGELERTKAGFTFSD